MTMMTPYSGNRWVTAGIVTAGIGLMLGACATTEAPPRSAPPPTVPAKTSVPKGPQPGERAPAFSLETLNPAECGRERVRTADVVGSRASKGSRGLVLSFGASWCGPCRAEAPELSGYAAELAERGVQVWFIVTDAEKDGVEAMRRYLVDTVGTRAPVLADVAAILTRRYGARSVPYHVVIGADGRISWARFGADPELRYLRQAVEGLP